MTRWKLILEWDGAPFMGWQRQNHGPSVQGALERAARRMTGEEVTAYAAGRTDAGVHALAMAIHIDLAKDVTAAADSRCKAVASERANGSLKFTWSFEWPPRAQWNAGQRWGYCWVPET